MTLHYTSQNSLALNLLLTGIMRHKHYQQLQEQLDRHCASSLQQAKVSPGLSWVCRKIAQPIEPIAGSAKEAIFPHAAHRCARQRDDRGK